MFEIQNELDNHYLKGNYLINSGYKSKLIKRVLEIEKFDVKFISLIVEDSVTKEESNIEWEMIAIEDNNDYCEHLIGIVKQNRAEYTVSPTKIKRL